jgi:hypothetical protein
MSPAPEFILIAFRMLLAVLVVIAMTARRPD